MHVLLFTGKGGVGKTTIAAATATLTATRGRKTLVVSTDSAHSLADALGVSLGEEPTEVGGGLYGLHVNSQRAFERSWKPIQRCLADLLTHAGVDEIQAEELVVIPGAEEILTLLAVSEQAAHGLWDVIVVDCAPTAETLRLLSLPEALMWYVERLFPKHHRVMRSLAPFMPFAGGTSSSSGVFEAIEKLHDQLTAVQQLLHDPHTAIRLVLTPESVVVAEARRTLTNLALYGYYVDSVVANRIFPSEESDAWRSSWIAAQEKCLADIRSSFEGVPLRQVSYQSREPLGHQALGDLAFELYRNEDPLALSERRETLTVRREDQEYVLSLRLQRSSPQDISLTRSGDDLVFTVDDRRRVIALPGVLQRCEVVAATMHEQALHVRFRPDPQLWPKSYRQ